MYGFPITVQKINRKEATKISQVKYAHIRTAETQLSGEQTLSLKMQI